MTHPSCRAAILAASILVGVALVDEVAARGGGRGGGGGGGFSRVGPAASGSFGQNRAAGMNRGYYARGPAANGNLDARYPSQDERQGQRQERREERQEQRIEHHEDWHEYAEDHYDDHDGDYDRGDYGVAGAVAVDAAVAEPFYYYSLPCTPIVMAMGGAVYYVCGADRYIRAYSDGDVVYTLAPPPGED